MRKLTDILEAIPLCEAYMDGVDDGCSSCPYNGRCSELVKDTMDTLRDLEQRVPRWISVEDEQKPKHHEEVLCRYVFDGDSQCFYAVLTYYAYGDNGYVTGQHFTGEGLHDMRVTHWMPLPEPPEEEKHETD